MAADTATPTALDLAVELVATKVALMQAIETLTGTSPIDTTKALEEWAYESPLELPWTDAGYGFEEAFRNRLDPRVDEIEDQILRAVGSFLIAKADRLAASRG